MEFFFPEFDAEEFYLKVILLPGLIVMSGPVLVCSLVMKLYFFLREAEIDIKLKLGEKCRLFVKYNGGFLFVELY